MINVSFQQLAWKQHSPLEVKIFCIQVPISKNASISQPGYKKNNLRKIFSLNMLNKSGKTYQSNFQQHQLST